MRRWLSKFGNSSSASSSRISSPVSHDNPYMPPSASADHISYANEPWSFMHVPPSSSGVEASSLWNADFASDPSSWEKSFAVHWGRVGTLIDHCDEITAEQASVVFYHFGQMVQLLMMEMNAQPESVIGPILDNYFTDQIVERVVDWALVAPDFLAPRCQIALLRIFEIMITESHTQNHCALVHKPILLPLMKLLEWCRQSSEKSNFQPLNTDKNFVVLLNQICGKMAEDSTLLSFFFTFGVECDQQFLVFSLLIPYLYDTGDIGQIARDALLLILSVSRSLDHIAEFISEKSNFCPVVATGLSGCFSQLPLNISSVLHMDEDWHKLSNDNIESNTSLSDFRCSLLFCNAVIQVAHEYIVSKIIMYIHNGFLLPVVLPSLLQTGQEELISSTAYYHLCLETVSEPSLIQALIKLLIVEECELNKKVVDVIVERISIGNRLSQVSLSLLRSLIDLKCEDVMLDLIFRYLLPCTFLQPNQLFRLKNRKYAISAANYFLSLIPDCMQKFHVLCSQETLHAYLVEARREVQQTADACSRAWHWEYDGLNPSYDIFRSGSDDDNATNQGSFFIRQASNRSSLLSSRNGINRYFASRGMHATSESFWHQCPLPDLGDKVQSSPTDILSNDLDSLYAIEDEMPYIFAPCLQNSLMMSSSFEYFQLAYDENSESDAEYRAYAKQSDDASNVNEKYCENTMKSVINRKSSLTSGEFDTDIEMARSFVLQGWAEIEDTETFMEILESAPLCKSSHSLEENLALIDSKVQYLDELKDLSDVMEKSVEKCDGAALDEFKESSKLSLGFRIMSHEHQGVGPLLESLFRLLENMLDNPLYVNLHLTSVLAALATFTHPLLACYLFDQNSVLRPGIKNLRKILAALKTRVDTYAASFEGFNVLLERGIKFMKTRADRYEKSSENIRHFLNPIRHSSNKIIDERLRNGSHSDSINYFPRSLSGNGPANDANSLHGFRYFSHKARETSGDMSDNARAKQFAFVAIILSQFCQKLATIVLHHCTVVSDPRSSHLYKDRSSAS